MTQTEKDSPSSMDPLDAFISKATLDAIPYVIGVYRPDGVMVGYNQAAERFWGIPREHIVGLLNIYETPGVTGEDIIRSLREAFEGHEQILPPVWFDLSQAEGLADHTQKAAWLESMFLPLRDPNGAVEYVLVMQHDVTELIEQRTAIEKAQGKIAEQRELITRLENAQRQIDEQRETIQALESPIIEVGEGVLMLPVIGAVTERRAIDMMDKVLGAVSSSNARYLILDLTGSQHVDTTTANHFSNILRAVTLLGAQGLVAGIHPHIAQTIVSLGLDLRGIPTYRNLREALNHCARETREAHARVKG
jgi:anti-anti-sigma regulatory factor